MSDRTSNLMEDHSKLHLKDCPESIQKLVRKVADDFQRSGRWPTADELHLMREDLSVTQTEFNAFGQQAFEFRTAGGVQTAVLNLWALYDSGIFAGEFDDALEIVAQAFGNIRSTGRSVVVTRDQAATRMGRDPGAHYVDVVRYIFSRAYLLGYQDHSDHGWELAIDVQRYSRSGPSIEGTFLGRPTRPSSHAATELFLSADSVTSDAAGLGLTKSTQNTKVFIVHGHDHGMKETVARFVGVLGLKPIILHEQANRGRTIAEKLDAHKDVGFAIVLLAPDDVGKRKTSKRKPLDRARQNVVLELGYFWGALGRERVCAVVKGKIEPPSDYDSVVYVIFDKAGAWKLELAKELRAAGYKVDPTKV